LFLNQGRLLPENNPGGGDRPAPYIPERVYRVVLHLFLYPIRYKNQINNDFHRFAAHLGLNEKQILNVFNRFASAIPEMEPVIDRGFLPQQKADEFKQLIKERTARLELYG
jgi:hypothetical protein